MENTADKSALCTIHRHLRFPQELANVPLKAAAVKAVRIPALSGNQVPQTYFSRRRQWLRELDPGFSRWSFLCCRCWSWSSAPVEGHPPPPAHPLLATSQLREGPRLMTCMKSLIRLFPTTFRKRLLTWSISLFRLSSS